MPAKKQKANYGALFNAGAAIHSGAFPKAESITSTTLSEEDYSSVQMLPIDDLLDNPYQPRLLMDEESLQQLAATIKDQGFQGVLVARVHPTEAGMYQITAGHRRREAAKKAGLATLPVVVKKISDEDMAVLAVTENIQREDLTPLEEGKIFCLMMEQMGLTLEQVAESVKKSESYVRNRRRVAMAPEDIQQMVAKKPDSLRAVFYLLKVEDKTVRSSIIELILQGQLTADQVDQYVKTLEQKPTADISPVPVQSVPSQALNFVLPRSSGQQIETITDEFASSLHAVHSHERTQSQDDAASSQPQDAILGVSKLKTLLKSIKTYAKLAAKREKISIEEAELLDQIAEEAQDIRNTLTEPSSL